MIAPVGADVFVQDALTHDGLEHVVESFGDIRLGPALGLGFGCDVGVEGVLQSADGVETLALELCGAEQLANAACHQPVHALLERLRDVERWIGVLGFAQGGTHLVLALDDALVGLLRQLQRFDHQGFVHFVGASLDHDDGVGAAGDAQVQAAFRHLRDRGVDDELTVDIADAHTGDGAIEGDVRYGQRC